MIQTSFINFLKHPGQPKRALQENGWIFWHVPFALSSQGSELNSEICLKFSDHSKGRDRATPFATNHNTSVGREDLLVL